MSTPTHIAKAAAEKQVEQMLARVKALQLACPLPQVGNLACALGMLLSDNSDTVQAGIIRLLVLGRIVPEIRAEAEVLAGFYLDTIATAARTTLAAT